jgi:diguanylate cyclase (GGDEF)-like protein
MGRTHGQTGSLPVRFGLLSLFPIAVAAAVVGWRANRLVVAAVSLALWGALVATAWLVSLDFVRQARGNAYLAHHDSLTGLPNRAHFVASIGTAVAAAGRERRSVAVLMFDLERFEDVNDALGHRAGDAVLARIAERLPSLVRDRDVVARLGGDTFGLLLGDLGDLGDPGDLADRGDRAPAHDVAERVLEAIAEPIVADGVLLTLRASVGVAMFPDDATEAALLFERADIALHQAMRSADPIVSYCAGTDPNSADRLRLVGELRVAVDRGELEVFYQPLVSVANGTVVAVEALVRWHHPRRGLVAPDEFIPLAEHTGLIFPLTVVVLEQAVRQCRVWRDEGRMITMAVNISARSLDDPLLPTVLEAVLERWSVPADAIMIEVTETALASDVEVAVDALERLKRIGVHIALDDFGTGFSSLVQLRLLPIDEIKIDRSFVSRMVDADLDFQIVRSLVELGARLGLVVVAEGVETPRVAQHLDALGCHLAQGYLFSRPVPAADADGWAWPGEAEVRDSA